MPQALGVSPCDSVQALTWSASEWISRPASGQPAQPLWIWQRTYPFLHSADRTGRQPMARCCPPGRRRHASGQAATYGLIWPCTHS